MASIEELTRLDSEFTESGFKAKVDNTFIMILSGIIDRDMKKVQHKISNELYERYNLLVEQLKNNKEIQMYDELNVKNTFIKDINITDTSYIITVKLVSRYMDYIIDENTKKYKRGINTYRVEHDNTLIFVKRRDAKKMGVIRQCTYCGASIDFNSNGICSFCRKPFETEKYDWVLTSLETR